MRVNLAPEKAGLSARTSIFLFRLYLPALVLSIFVIYSPAQSQTASARSTLSFPLRYAEKGSSWTFGIEVGKQEVNPGREVVQETLERLALYGTILCLEPHIPFCAEAVIRRVAGCQGTSDARRLVELSVSSRHLHLGWCGRPIGDCPSIYSYGFPEPSLSRAADDRFQSGPAHSSGADRQ